MPESSFYTENKIKRSRRAVIAAVVLLTFLFENTQGLFPRPWGIPAMLSVPLVISIGMFERETYGMLFGLMSGALLDAFSSQSVCYHSIMLTLAGFVSGVLVTRLLRNNLKTCIMMCTVFLFIYNSLFYLIFYFKASGEAADYVYFDTYLPSVIYSSFFIPVFYWIVRAIVKKFRTE